jgi:hypothetical protein
MSVEEYSLSGLARSLVLWRVFPMEIETSCSFRQKWIDLVNMYTHSMDHEILLYRSTLCLISVITSP